MKGKVSKMEVVKNIKKKSKETKEKKIESLCMYDLESICCPEDCSGYYELQDEKDALLKTGLTDAKGREVYTVCKRLAASTNFSMSANNYEKQVVREMLKQLLSEGAEKVIERVISKFLNNQFKFK